MDYLSGQSEASDLSDLSAESDTISLSESDGGDDIFDEWANSAGLETTIRDNCDLPATLHGVLRDSQIVPRWILNETSPEYEYSRQTFGDMAMLLSLASRNKGIEPVDDDELSRDVRSSLYTILSVPMRDSVLRDKGPCPSEIDRRTDVNFLGIHTWDFQGGEDFQYRNECILPRPITPLMLSGGVAINAIVGITLPEIGIGPTGSSGTAAPPSFGHDPSLGFRTLLHWVIGYECEGCSACATRRVLQGLASALHQRRALGFMDHFSFGMVHHSTSLLDVFAASWECREPPNMSSDGKTIDSIEGTRTDEGENITGVAFHTTGYKDAQHGGSTMQPKIVVYRLVTFDMGSPLDILRLYLLMRSTRSLGRQYKTDIVNALPTSISLRGQVFVGFDELSTASQNTSPTESSGRSSKRPRLEEPVG